MQKAVKLATRRSLRSLAAFLVGVCCSLGAQAGAFDCPSQADRYSPYYADHQPGLQQEINRLREQMRRQERQLAEQTRLQREQSKLLQRQVTLSQQVSAIQACYYRLDAGLDLCDDLFRAPSQEHFACRAKLAEKNPARAVEVSQSRARRAE